MTAKSILDQEFPEMRCRLIDLAAAMDRTERMQMQFSDAYFAGWQGEFGLAT
jgi:hypothetical protein